MCAHSAQCAELRLFVCFVYALEGTTVAANTLNRIAIYRAPLSRFAGAVAGTVAGVAAAQCAV